MNLIEQCKAAIAKDILNDGKPRITVVMKSTWAKTGKKKLFKLPESPVGNIFSDGNDGEVLVSFDAKEVLSYCEQLTIVLQNKRE